MTGPGGEWVVPSSTSPLPTSTTGCSCGEHFLRMLSASSFKDLLSASVFLPMTGEVPAVEEIAQKWQDIYNVRGGGGGG